MKDKPKCKNKYKIIDEDFISKLPDALLTQILSLLPDSDANRTRILSNRWKNLYAFLPDLHFVMPSNLSFKQVIKFHDFIGRTLAIRDSIPIRRFFLMCCHEFNYNRFYHVLCVVVQLKVQHLVLMFPNNKYNVRPVGLCWDLFKTCNTLVELTLKGVFVLHVPKQTDLLFPCLKKMELVSVAYRSDEAFTNLISGCLVLEELIVERTYNDGSDNVGTYKVSSLSLKRLRMFFSSGGFGYGVVIDAPKLEYLYIWDDMHIDYSLTEPLALVEAHINNDSVHVFQLIRRLSYSKMLTLTLPTIHVLGLFHGLDEPMPVFRNLVKLVIGLHYIWHSDLLLAFLNNMPNLEHITFADGLSRGDDNDDIDEEDLIWNTPVEPPTCLHSNMKEIIVLNPEAVTEEELTFIRYLLKHTSKLEKFTLNAHEVDPEVREQLLSLDRGSNLCRVEFV